MVETRQGTVVSPHIPPEGPGGMKEAPGATGVTATAGCAGRRGLAGLRLSSSQLYTLLAVTLAGMALPAIFAPKLMARVLFGSAAYPVEDQHKHLLQLNAGALLATAATAVALEEAARKNMLHTFTADALKVALAAFGATCIMTQLWYPATLTALAALVSIVANAGLLALPASQLVSPQDIGRVSRDFMRVPRSLPSFFRLRRPTVKAALYMLLAVMYPLAGVSYFLAPKFTLYRTFGYAYGKSTMWLWKVAGAADFTIMTAICITLKDKAENNLLGRSISRTLNLGLMAGAILHLFVLGPILSAGHGGLMLPVLVATWGTALLTGMLGLASPELEQLAEQTAEAAKTE